jgi:CRISPR-associated protein Csc3
MQQAYQRIKAVRISDKEFWTALRDAQDLRDPNFWQRLEAFLFRQVETADTAKFQRVLRYSEDAQGTFFTVGFRNIDPTETESWILPTLLALVFSICLDVKVVASDSSVPLMLESSELPETIWLDGAHAAIQALVGDGRLNIDGVGEALARLTAAYLIHLDTEYAPPDENWHRFGPIAHALMESPFYVFYFLKQQQRDGERKIGIDQVRRYISYADTLFNFNEEGEQQMSHARELVTLYRGFYRAKTLKNANSILRPISVVADALLIADTKLFHDEESLIEVAYGELYRFMERVGKGLADGRFPKGVTVPERNQAMQEFCVKFVRDIFIGTFNRDVAALRGKQLNLLRSACETIYRKAQYDEWAARGIDASAAEEAEEIDDETVVTDMQ